MTTNTQQALPLPSMPSADDWRYDPPQSPWLDLLYSDEHILVANKPSELLSVPGRDPAHHDSLLSRIRAQHPEAAVVHRLDLPTSGLMVVALTMEAQRDLMCQFRERQVGKRYVAVVAGLLSKSQGLIDLPLICDWPNRPRQIVDWERGKPSQTRWQRVSTDVAQGTSRVALEPITGRSHQLRVHLAAIGHPILGDRFYAPGHWQQRAHRLLLHAEWLSFSHPIRREALEFSAVPAF